jgi:peroxiredoxin
MTDLSLDHPPARTRPSYGTPVADALTALHAERVATWPAEQLALNIAQRRELVERWPERRLPAVGTALPDVRLIDVDEGETSLSALAGGRPLVLLFFRYAGCPACNTALPVYRDRLWPRLRERGVGLAALSPQVPDLLVDIRRRHALPFPVLTDPDNGFARRLGILFKANAGSRAQALAAGRPLGEVTGTGTSELPLPAALLIAPDLTLRFLDASPDWMVRTEPGCILDAVDALN